MQHLDVIVLEHALKWAREHRDVWLCTVLSTFGSAPRSPGAMLIATEDLQYQGSLSGGCVEEEFLRSIEEGKYRSPAQYLVYGKSSEERERLQLPCGGALELLVEHRRPCEKWIAHLEDLLGALKGQQRLMREVELENGDFSLARASVGGQAVTYNPKRAIISIGPAMRLILAGLSPVAQICGQFAKTLGFEVIACDPREEVRHLQIDGVELLPVLPSMYIAKYGCHAATAVVALTHDPKIDDLALMEAVNTDAFYIGAMGSQRTSSTRAERLIRIGGLDHDQVNRLHMPIGLDIGSRTPAEIALSVLADVLRVYNGKSREEL
ncbi:XdhC family protein [Pseudomonas sp. R81]|uniref:XdhC family protein n=1 Tax=Pseudomonas sp. R81 TaxID=1144885 RepID=UPI00029A5001|nr:XdhC family protein [Pseudomonas sp. R81]